MAALLTTMFSPGSFYDKNINLMRQPVCAANVNISSSYIMQSVDFLIALVKEKS